MKKYILPKIVDEKYNFGYNQINIFIHFFSVHVFTNKKVASADPQKL